MGALQVPVGVAVMAERNQILLGIGTTVATVANMMYFELSHAPADLTAPAIPLENP